MSKTFQNELLHDEPILLHRVDPGYTYRQDASALIEETMKLLDTASEPVYFLADYRELKISLDDLIQAATVLGRGMGALYHHPNILKIVGIVTDPMLKMTARGMSSDIFGNLPIVIFDTVDEGLAYAREEIAAKESQQR